MDGKIRKKKYTVNNTEHDKEKAFLTSSFFTLISWATFEAKQLLFPFKC